MLSFVKQLIWRDDAPRNLKLVGCHHCRLLRRRTGSYCQPVKRDRILYANRGRETGFLLPTAGKRDWILLPTGEERLYPIANWGRETGSYCQPVKYICFYKDSLCCRKTESPVFFRFLKLLFNFWLRKETWVTMCVKLSRMTGTFNGSGHLDFGRGDNFSALLRTHTNTYTMYIYIYIYIYIYMYKVKIT